MKSIEQNVKEICRRKGLTFTDVANRTGNTPSNLLSSLKGNPKLSTLEEVAAALQVSVSEILTMRPELATGLVIIGGETYALSKPAAATVKIPTFDRYDVLRGEVRTFIANSIEASETASKMGILDTMEFFSLVHDAGAQRFTLSLCYADGKTHTSIYDKLEYCSWRENDTEETVRWDLDYLIQEIINDIESTVPSKLQAE